MRLLSDYIKEYNAFTEDECQMIIDYYEENESRVSRSQVYQSHEHDNLEGESDSRTSNEMTVPLDAPIDLLISSRINRYFAQYHWDLSKMYDREWENNQDKDVPENTLRGFVYEDEGYSIVKYDSGKGYFDWHHDRLDDDRKASQRVFSCLIYLNDNFDEGETDFYWHKVVPETGKILFFPSDHHWIHKGRKPLNGDKYIITTWLYQAINNGKAEVPTDRDYQKYINKFQK